MNNWKRNSWDPVGMKMQLGDLNERNIRAFYYKGNEIILTRKDEHWYIYINSKLADAFGYASQHIAADRGKIIVDRYPEVTK